MIIGYFSANTLGIPLAFLMFAALLTWIVIGVKGWWLLKAAATASVLFFFVSLWTALGSYSGWATEDSMPKKFQVLWGLAQEPSETDKDGAVYLWIIELSEEQPSWNFLDYANKKTEPRCYVLPYSQELHQELNKAKKSIARGKPVFGESNGEGDGQFAGKGNGKGKSGTGGTGGLDHRQIGDLKFYELPPPKFPEKQPQAESDAAGDSLF